MKYYIPTKVYQEIDAVKVHAEELAGYGSYALIVTGKYSARANGALADVEAALEAATAKAESMTGIVTKYKISRPTEDTEKMLKLNAFDKGTPHKVTDEEVEEI